MVSLKIQKIRLKRGREWLTIVCFFHCQERQCSTVQERQCQKVNEEQCETKNEQECTTTNEQVDQ